MKYPCAPPPPVIAANASARERLLATAERLIYSGGIHATGIDAIVRASGAARKSMYGHFASKSDLVAAALVERDARWMKWFEAGVRAAGDAPRTQLLAMFDLLRGWFASDGFHGCAFLNAAGEIGAADDPIRRVAQMHKARLLGFIETVCVAYCSDCANDITRPHRNAHLGKIETTALDPHALARQWLILIDGAIGVALVSGRADAALDARALAEQVLHAATQTVPQTHPQTPQPGARP